VHTKYVQASQVDAVGGQSSSINDYYRTSTNAGSSYYSETVQKAKSKLLVRCLIVGCGLPVSIVENPQFIKFMSDIDPKLVLPTRYMISNTHLPKVVEDRGNGACCNQEGKIRLFDYGHLD
jgi:hypothetical protein